MKLWIVVNEFLRTNKFRELEYKFASAADRLDIEYEIVTNSDCMVCFGSNEITTGVIPCNNDPVLFWDKDIILAKALEKSGHRLYNSSNAIAVCDDKSLTSYMLADSGIRMPVTFVSPMTYSNIGYTDTEFITISVERLGLPLIVKEVFGSFGAGVYLCESVDEITEIIKSKKGTGFIFQEYINTSNGKDIRLQVAGDRVVTAMYRYSVNGDFRANVTNGGLMKPYDPTEEEIAMALDVTKKLGLDFAGVDILFGEKEPVLCEVNSNAHFKNIDDCTGSDVAYDILSYIVTQD